MSLISQHKNLPSYAKHIEQHGPDVPIKVMGAKDGKKYFSLSMMYDMWTRIQNPDTQQPFTTVITEFGEIRSRGAVLHADKTYSAIAPPAKGINLFQGDIIELDAGTKCGHPKHRYSIVLSHSCDIQKLSHVLIAPAFLESELSEKEITFLRNGKATDKKQSERFIELWSENESVQFVGLPPSNVTTERIIVALPLSLYCPQNIVISKPPALRLTYRALNYLHFRLATALLRDVQDSDETRDL